MTPTNPEPSPTGRYVLLIDDDPINNLICEELLRVTGFARQVTSFLDPRTALEWLQQNPVSWPDLLFLDINMPGLNAWEFLDEFARLNLKRSLKTWILSSSLSTQDRQQAKRYTQIEGYLVKPLSHEHLTVIAQASPHESVLS